MNNFDLKKYLAEGKLNENYKTDEIVMDKLKDIMRDHDLSGMDVMEMIGQEFGIAFEFGRIYR